MQADLVLHSAWKVHCYGQQDKGLTTNQQTDKTVPHDLMMNVSLLFFFSKNYKNILFKKKKMKKVYFCLISLTNKSIPWEINSI